MRLLIVKLAGTMQHSVALSMVAACDSAELVDTVEDAVTLLGQRMFDGAVLMGGRSLLEADAALSRLRERAPWLSVVLLSLAAPRERAGHGRAGRHETIALDSAAGRLSVGGHAVPLSQAEFRLFERLWTGRGATVTADALMEALYPDGARPGSRVLPVFLFKLRRKLSLVGLEDLVRTAIGRGFTIPADEAEAEGAEAEGADMVTANGGAP